MRAKRPLPLPRHLSGRNNDATENTWQHSAPTAYRGLNSTDEEQDFIALANRIERSSLTATMAHENAALVTPMIQSVRDAIDMEGKLEQAQSLLDHLSHEPQKLPVSHDAARGNPLTTAAMERLCGITCRWLTSDTRRHRLEATRALYSDVQYNEILPNGKVVTLTEVSSGVSDQEPIGPAAGESALPSLQGKWFLHFVLHKEGMSIDAAYRELCQRAQLTTKDFEVNVLLDEQSATTQCCSLPLGSSSLSEATAKAHRLWNSIAAVNLRPTTLRIQWLGIKSFPCSFHSGAQCMVRTTMLLRSVSQKARLMRSLATRALLMFPNFFGVRRFFSKSPREQFWLMHIGEAVARRHYRLALLMMVYNNAASVIALKSGATITVAEVFTQPSRWLEENRGVSWFIEFAEMIRLGEDREDMFESLYDAKIDEATRRAVRWSREAVMWNVSLSIRIKLHQSRSSRLLRRSELNEQRSQEEYAEEAPEIGDATHDKVPQSFGHDSEFVMSAVRVGDCVINNRDSKGEAIVPPLPADAPDTTGAEALKLFDAPENEKAKGISSPRLGHSRTMKLAQSRLARRPCNGIEANPNFDVKWEFASPSAIVPSKRLVLSLWQSTFDRAQRLTQIPLHERRFLETVHVVDNVDDALRFDLDDLLIPLAPRGRKNEMLWSTLGFTLPTIADETEWKVNGIWRVPPLRKAFIRARGPLEKKHAAKVAGGSDAPMFVVRTLTETMDDVEQSVGGMIRLCTDAELTASSKRQFTAHSRGEVQGLWPIGRVGHLLHDRLPIGSLVEDPSSSQSGYQCLALHFDIPSSSYVSSVLREFVTIRSVGAAATQRHNSEAAPARPTTPQPSELLTSQPSHVDEAAEDRSGNILKIRVRGLTAADASRQGIIHDNLSGGRAVPRAT